VVLFRICDLSVTQDLDIAMSLFDINPDPLYRRHCSECGSFLPEWEEHSYCVKHYTIDCTKGGACLVCGDWEDEKWENAFLMIAKIHKKREETELCKQQEVVGYVSPTKSSKSSKKGGKGGKTPPNTPVSSNFLLQQHFALIDKAKVVKRKKKKEETNTTMSSNLLPTEKVVWSEDLAEVKVKKARKKKT